MAVEKRSQLYAKTLVQAAFSHCDVEVILVGHFWNPRTRDDRIDGALLSNEIGILFTSPKSSSFANGDQQNRVFRLLIKDMAKKGILVSFHSLVI